MGGSETDPGIFINWSLRLGTTASRCITFNKFWPISRDLVFDIRILELWVVNEVFMNKRHISKRDFYSTVVMWNRIGRHKAKEDYRRPGRRDCCFHNQINTCANDNYYHSHTEIHETDERHFEPSNPCLTGDNIDDELLIAIKNRLAGMPPMPGALSLKPESKLQMTNQEPPMTSIKPKYLVDRQPSKSKKVPTQVSTQVDDNMITELKNQGTSTSHVKVTSRCTQSGIGLAAQMEGTAQLRNSSSRMQRADEGYQRALPQEQNIKLYQTSSRTLQSDEQYQRPLQPRRNSFPNHTKQSLPSRAVVSPRANYAEPPPSSLVTGNSIQGADQYNLPDPSIHTDRNSLSLPEVPDFYGMSLQRPSVSRSVRSSTDDAPYHQQTHELSWSNRNNMGAILPYQQQLVRAAANRGDQYEDKNLKQPSQSGGLLRDGSREANGNITHQDRPSPTRSIREIDSYQDPSHYQDRQSPSRNIREVDPYRGHSQYQYRPSPSRSLRERDQEAGDRENPIYQDHPPPRGSMREGSRRDQSPPRVRLETPLDDQRESPSIQPPSPEQPTVLTMTTRHVEGGQMCRCGSKELNLVCGCKKSTLKEVEITKMDEFFTECRCPRKCDSEEDESKSKKKKKDKKRKVDKEAKAEEKKRKKEEKEREKKERARQKAREKEERKKSKSKGAKKSKNKGGNNKMCSCCKCCGDEGETTIVPSETSRCSDDKSKKKSKKEKKPRAKKEKKPKAEKKEKSKECSTDPPIRSCKCPPAITTEVKDRLSPQPTQVQIQQDQVQEQQLTDVEPSVLGFCNHPDIPCPALGNREMGQGRVQSHKSVTTPQSCANYCGDPVCTNKKRIKQSDMSAPRTCSCEAPNVFRSCCCANTSGGCRVNVCSYVANAAVVEQQPVVNRTSTTVRANSPSVPTRNSRSPTQTSSMNMNPDAMGYRGFTAAPALIFPKEVGHGDTSNVLRHYGASTTDTRSTPLRPGFSTPDNVIIDLLKRDRENSTNKRYVPPCVLYLDCTKVRDLCVIIKDKYDDPS